MQVLDQFARALVALLAWLAALVLTALAALEDWLRGLMTGAGVPGSVQTIFGIVLAVLFLVAALRLFGGFIRVVLVVVLVALSVHALTHAPAGRLVPPPAPPGRQSAPNAPEPPPAPPDRI